MINYKDKCKQVDWNKDYNKTINDNYRLLNEIIEDCVKRDSIEGMILSFSVGDGDAYYQVVKENKNTVQVELCENLGDDYRLDTIGVKGSLKKNIALAQLNFKKQLVRYGILNYDI